MAQGELQNKKMTLNGKLSRSQALASKRGAGAIATNIAVYLRSFAEVRVQVEPQPYAHIPLRAHGIRVLYRSIFCNISERHELDQ